jgi:hypothetical protein
MARTREQIHEDRRRLRAEYGDLFDKVAAVLFRLDPIGINFDDNQDEYEPEAGTILPRLKTCASPEDALRVVHEEFCRWFGADTAGGRQHYQEIANGVWELWLRRAQLPPLSS